VLTDNLNTARPDPHKTKHTDQIDHVSERTHIVGQRMLGLLTFLAARPRAPDRRLLAMNFDAVG